MDTQTFEEILKDGETATIEFKLQPPRVGELAERLCGFANTRNGGTIIIGVEDKTWQLVGVRDVSEAIDTILQAARACKPTVALDRDGPQILQVPPHGRRVVYANILPNKGKLHQHGGVFWIRRGTHTVPMETNEIEDFFYENGHLDWEIQTNEKASLEDLDQELIETYMQQFSIITGKPSRSESQWQRLLKLDCVAKVSDIESGDVSKKMLKPTNAGLLLFGISPREFFTGAEVVATFYQDETGVRRYTDRRIITGTISHQIDACSQFLRDHIQIGARIEGFQRVDEPDYSIESLREAVVNGVVHRNYGLKGEAVRVFFYSDRIEIHSPGTLLPGINLELLRQGLARSRPRNQVIASVMRDMPGHYMERVGSGISFILNQSNALNLPKPEFKEQGGEFVVTFFKRLDFNSSGSFNHKPNSLRGSQSEIPSLDNPFNILGKKVNPATELSLIKLRRQETGLAYISEHGSITNKEYRTLTGASENTALRDLEALVEQGTLRMIGKGRGRRYIM